MTNATCSRRDSLAFRVVVDALLALALAAASWFLFERGLSDVPGVLCFAALVAAAVAALANLIAELLAAAFGPVARDCGRALGRFAALVKRESR